eukprot:GHVS01010061.1.p1 GENE.GHVS01010061.1~~GHVS01010061.1.p1  ORF type:complete len:1086 (+),score=155.87 GHVS01010061.1:113-3370(+)
MRGTGPEGFGRRGGDGRGDDRSVGSGGSWEVSPCTVPPFHRARSNASAPNLPISVPNLSHQFASRAAPPPRPIPHGLPPSPLLPSVNLPPSTHRKNTSPQEEHRPRPVCLPICSSAFFHPSSQHHHSNSPKDHYLTRSRRQAYREALAFSSSPYYAATFQNLTQVRRRNSHYSPPSPYAVPTHFPSSSSSPADSSSTVVSPSGSAQVANSWSIVTQIGSRDGDRCGETTAGRSQQSDNNNGDSNDGSNATRRASFGGGAAVENAAGGEVPAAEGAGGDDGSAAAASSDILRCLDEKADLSTVTQSSLPWLRQQTLTGVFDSNVYHFLNSIAVVVGYGTFNNAWSLCISAGPSLTMILPVILHVWLLGLPMLQLEMVLGNIFRGGATKVVKGLKDRMSVLGFIMMVAVFCTALIVSGYTADCLMYLRYASRSPPPYVVTNADYDYCETLVDRVHCMDNPTDETGTPRIRPLQPLCSYSYSLYTCVPNEVAKTSRVYQYLKDPTYRTAATSQQYLLALFATWGLALLYLLPGAFFYAYFSAVLLFLSIILWVRLVWHSLQFASAELFDNFLPIDFNSDWCLLGGHLMSRCSVFVIFGLSLGIGVHSAVAAKTKICTSIIPSSYAVTIIDTVLSIASLLAPISVVVTVGVSSGLSPEVLVDAGRDTPALFSVYAMGTMPVRYRLGLFGLYFYACVSLMTLQTLALCLEGLVTILQDVPLLQGVRRASKCVMVCTAGFCLSLPLMTSFSLDYVYYLDYCCMSVLVPFVSLAFVVTATWWYGMERQAVQVGLAGVVLFNFSCCTTAIAVGVFSALKWRWTATGLICTYPLWLAISAQVAKRANRASMKSITFCLLFGNIEYLRYEVNRISCGGRWRIYRFTLFWSFCVKYLIPAFLIQTLTYHIFSSVASTDASLAVGIGISFICFLIFFFAFLPFFPSLLPSSAAYIPLSTYPSRLLAHRLSVRQLLSCVLQEFQRSSVSPFLVNPEFTPWRLADFVPDSSTPAAQQPQLGPSSFCAGGVLGEDAFESSDASSSAAIEETTSGMMGNGGWQEDDLVTDEITQQENEEEQMETDEDGGGGGRQRLRRART